MRFIKLTITIILAVVSLSIIVIQVGKNDKTAIGVLTKDIKIVDSYNNEIDYNKQAFLSIFNDFFTISQYDEEVGDSVIYVKYNNGPIQYENLQTFNFYNSGYYKEDGTLKNPNFTFPTGYTYFKAYTDPTTKQVYTEINNIGNFITVNGNQVTPNQSYAVQTYTAQRYYSEIYRKTYDQLTDDERKVQLLNWYNRKYSVRSLRGSQFTSPAISVDNQNNIIVNDRFLNDNDVLTITYNGRYRVPDTSITGILIALIPLIFVAGALFKIQIDSKMND